MAKRILIKDDFKNLLEYQAWVKSSFENLSYLNRHQRSNYTASVINDTIRFTPDVFGNGTTFKELENGVKFYKRPELIENLYQKISHELSPLLTQQLKSKKLKFNALGLGVFSFERAAMSLHTIKTEQGELKTKTDTKELFGFFPYQHKQNNAVEFFISNLGAANVKAEELLYGGLAAIILAELLTKAGYKVKINIVVASFLTNVSDTIVGVMLPAKNYEEPIDRNLTALLSSDARFLRFDGFKGLVSAYDFFKKSIPDDYGSAVNDKALKDFFENTPYAEKLISKHRFYFGGAFSEHSALRKIQSIIQEIISTQNP